MEQRKKIYCRIFACKMRTTMHSQCLKQYTAILNKLPLALSALFKRLLVAFSIVSYRSCFFHSEDNLKQAAVSVFLSRDAMHTFTLCSLHLLL